jgi:hypothetical protein
MTRQPSSCATMPLIVRAARMPISRPLITVSTTRPRSWSPASDEDIATISREQQDQRPADAGAELGWLCVSVAHDYALPRPSRRTPLSRYRATRRLEEEKPETHWNDLAAGRAGSDWIDTWRVGGYSQTRAGSGHCG